MVPKQRVSKSKNKGKPTNLSPLNLGFFFEGYNEEEYNVTFLGSQFTGNILFYENVDPANVRRGNYENVLHFLNNPYPIYLYYYMRGYIVPVTFWQSPDMQSLSYGTPIGWLGGEHMNSWMELLIRRRPLNANWTVAYTSTISVHPENNQFIILNDPHVIGTLDGSTRPYPSWNDVDWVFLPIHVAGNHWATGVIRLANSHFYVFDSMASEENKDVISLLIKCWTPVLNHILEDRGCLNETRRPHNFQYSYNQASETFWMWIFLWKETRLRQLMSSPGAPSAGPSTPPSYSSGPLTPPNYYPGSSRNAECSNCKHLRGKISVLKATMEMHMHPEQHTVNSAALFHEVLNEMEKLDLE
ncbi:transposase, MuDR, MULE transposase domain protein [Tanacetum coccineum]